MSACLAPSRYHVSRSIPAMSGFGFGPSSPLPDSADTRVLEPYDIVDQGHEGRCVGFAIAGLMNQLLRREGVTGAKVSGQYVYDEGRILEGVPLSEDRGMVIADGVQIAVTTGLPDESAWPYSAPGSVTPPPASVTQVAHHKVDLEFACPDRLTMLASIAQGFGVVGGIDCFSELMSVEAAATGEVPYPSDTKSFVGRHAIIFVAYDMPSKLVVFRNSWGGWGRAGFGTLPFQYIDDFASDMHSFRLAERA